MQGFINKKVSNSSPMQKNGHKNMKCRNAVFHICDIFFYFIFCFSFEKENEWVKSGLKSNVCKYMPKTKNYYKILCKLEWFVTIVIY